MDSRHISNGFTGPKRTEGVRRVVSWSKYHTWPAIIAAALVVIAQFIWSHKADVVWFETAELVRSDKGIVQMRITAYKARDCRYIPDSQVGYIRPANGDLEESGFSYVNDLSPNSSRPALWFRQSFGVWEWLDVIPPPDGITEVMTTVSHDCGDGQLRSTTIGPFKVPH